MKVLILVVMIVFSSCASTAEWKLEPVSKQKMRWRFCDQRDNYGDVVNAFNGKLCFWHRECKKSFLSKKCRRVLYMIDPKNKDRMVEWDIYNKIIL